MEYSLTVKRLRMQAVLDSIDGGNSPATIELRDAERVVLASLILQRPSFYLMGESPILKGPATAFVAVQGEAAIGSITDGSGNIIIDAMTVGVDPTLDETHDYEICLDDTFLQLGKQVTIISATIEHG